MYQSQENKFENIIILETNIISNNNSLINFIDHTNRLV